MAKTISTKRTPLVSWAWILAIPLGLAVSIGGGALLLRLLPVSPAVGLGLTIAATLLATLLFPLFLDRRLTVAYRAIDPSATSNAAQTVALWNAIVLVLLVVLLPHRMGTALQLRGDWMFSSKHSPLAEQARTHMHSLGVRLAREEVTTLRAQSPAVPLPPPARVDAGVGDAQHAARDASAVPAEPRDRAFTAQELFQFRADAVAVLTVRLRPSSETNLARQLGLTMSIGSGSGFVVDRDGLLVTNSHVIHGAQSIRVALRDGRAFDTVTIVAEDRSNDLALLRIDAHDLQAASLSQEDELSVGTRVTAIGNPLGYERTLTDGIINAVRNVQGTSMLQINAAIAPGSSGGPLFDDRGRVVGVTTATQRSGLSFAVHPRHVRALLAQTRSPRTLAAFLPEGLVENLRIEGAESDPVERLNLDALARQIASNLENCVSQHTNGTYFTQYFEGVSSRGPFAFDEHSRDESDFNDEGKRCLRSQLQMPARLLSMQIARTHDAELTPGHSVVVGFQVRFAAAGNRPERTLRLRFDYRMEATRAESHDE